ncbi:MAG: phosphatidate cytidylyltransferase [Aestuariivita sp.]|nr:phosphatidate cytidylyltransferase [Aestuariivita sp.]
MSSTVSWDDLRTRIVSSAIIIVLGLTTIMTGGVYFCILVATVCGLMIWELIRILNPDQTRSAILLAVLTGTFLICASHWESPYSPFFLGIPVIIGCILLTHYRIFFLFFAAVFLTAGFELILVRDSLGPFVILWMVAVVITTDVAGYFVGRLVGGPKLWPRISPHKTWSGTSAGWIASTLAGLAFAPSVNIEVNLIICLSVLLSLSAQLGDLTESALKRKMNIKDSGTFIPGHGGLLDRFDSLLGTSIMFLFLNEIIGVSEGLSI